MTRQNISTGTTANDGTGDTLRSAGTKINDNFVELYQAFGTDSNSLGAGITFDSAKVVFSGTTNTTTLTRFDPSTDVTIKLPDSNGEVVTIGDDNIVNLVDSTGSASKLYYGNVFSTEGDLPSATTYHGMFAHVHGTARAYFSHADSWHKILDSDTFTSRTDLTLINPRIDTHVFDSTGNFEILNLDNISGSPVNNVKISNATTGNSPTITSEGDDTNVGLSLSAKNNGVVSLDAAFAYTPQVLTAGSDSNLDSSSNLYLLNTASARSYFLHDGLTSGEVKRFLNRRTTDTTIEVNTNKLTTLNGDFSQMTIKTPMIVTCIWDGVGSQWFVDKDSDVNLTFA